MAVTIGNPGSGLPNGPGFAFFTPGNIGPNQELGRFVATKSFTFPQNFPGCEGSCDTAPTTNWTASLLQNGTAVGTVSMAAGQLTCTFSSSAVTNVNPGDVIALIGNGTGDPNMLNPSFTFQGYTT